MDFGISEILSVAEVVATSGELVAEEVCLSGEAASIISDLFLDDLGEIGEIFEDIKDVIEDELNIKDEIKKLFEDDSYLEDIENEDGVSNEQVSESLDLSETFEPDSEIEIEGTTYSTDSNGHIYKIDGYELIANNEYTIGNVKYKTDEQGRITSCEGKLTSTPEGERDNKAQGMAGGIDRLEGDQGSHIIARIFGGSKGIENMIALRGGAINQSVYKRMENEIAKALEEGKEVDVKVDIEYEGESERPSKVTVSYTIDGKETVVKFDNDEGSVDLLESLEDVLDEESYKDLKQEIQDAQEDGENISVVAVKIEYDENGNATKVTVTIRDESSERPVNEDRVYNL